MFRFSLVLGLFFVVLGISNDATAQVRCVAERSRLQGLLNSLRELEGLPPLPQGGTHAPLRPATPQGSGAKMANPELNAQAIQQWHADHDAEVAQLRAKLASSDCATLNPPPDPTHPYDLVFDQFDDTGIALSPVWQSTLTPPLFTTPDPSQCGNGNPWQPPCTTQNPTINNNTALCPVGALGGHANWMPVTYEGRLTWESHSLESQDDDYNFNLLPWIPAQTTIPWITSSDNALTGLHLEFSSDETIDHFHTPWWNSFHAAVDDDDSRSIDNPFGEPRREMVSGTSKALAMVFGRYAIVSGLMGLDCAHSCGAEVHPVWAMAIHVQDDPNDDRWVFFARNWGNEGYCGSKLDILNTQSFTFRLPWRPGATQVDIIGQNFLQRSKDVVPGVVDPRPDEQSLLVSLNLAAPDQRDRINGELHLRWQGSPQKSFLSAEATKVDAGAEARKKAEATKADAGPKARQRAEATKDTRSKARETAEGTKVPAVPRGREEVEAEASVAADAGKLSSRQRLVLKQKLPKRDLTADVQVSVLRRGRIAAAASTVPGVTMAPDPRGEQRSLQRSAALQAAKAKTH